MVVHFYTQKRTTSDKRVKEKKELSPGAAGKIVLKLDGRGRARPEAARRRKSECKIISARRISSRSNGRLHEMFSENTSTIPEVMDFSKFSRFFLGGGDNPCPTSGVC